MGYLQKSAGGHFDPRLVELFISLRRSIEDIRERFQDPSTPEVALDQLTD
jgi:response regulator RpfG family c-di-GMP phosphodiesterase